MDETRLRQTAIKWHKQFSHPPASKLLNLLSRAKVSHTAMPGIIENISANCETCLRYRKPPHKPAVSIPLAKRFNETIAMDLKDIRPGIKILHIVDHATRYSQATIVKNKSANEIVTKIFDTWIRIFGTPEQILVDNGGELNNGEFIDMCDKCNIKILTTAAESPWSNGLVEKHNGILGQMVTKVLSENNTSPAIAIHWCVAAKNSLTTVYGFSPNSLVFGREPNIPHSSVNSIAANDPEFYSLTVKENLDALHKAREAFFHQESSERLSRALNRQTRSYSDRLFVTGDDVFYKRDQSSRWQGPAKVLGKDSNQVLIKHGSSYLRVHPCRLLHQEQKPLQPPSNHTPVVANKENKNTNELEDSDDDSPKTLHKLDNQSDELSPNPAYSEPTDGEEEEQENPMEKLHDGEISSDSIYEDPDDSQAQLYSDDPQLACKNSEDNRRVPKKGQKIIFKEIGSPTIHTATCIGRAGKASTQSWHFVNIQDDDASKPRCVSLKDHIESWEPAESVNDTLIAIENDIFNEAKKTELELRRLNLLTA